MMMMMMGPMGYQYVNGWFGCIWYGELAMLLLKCCRPYRAFISPSSVCVFLGWGGTSFIDFVGNSFLVKTVQNLSQSVKIILSFHQKQAATVYILTESHQ